MFLLHLNQAIANSVGQAAATNVTTEILTVDRHDLCRVHVRPSKFPVEATVTLVKKGQREKATHLYGRFNNQTRIITEADEAEKFKLQIWG